MNNRSTNKKKKSKRIITLWLNILLPILAIAVLVGILYMLIVYNAKVSQFFNSPLNLTIAIALMVVFYALIVVMNLMNNTVSISGQNYKRGNSDDEMKRKDVGQLRFSKLSAIDAEMEMQEEITYYELTSLQKLCDGLRNYAAYKHGLYYDEMTIRSFIAGLAVNKLIIMQGISGTGKTSLGWVFGEYIGHSSSIIPVQPSWKERTDLLGYYNEFTRTYHETEFLKVLYEAGYTKDMCITILDEMNIARVEYYFAEFLSLLEVKQKDCWQIDLVSSGWENDPKRLKNGMLTLPENMWYIGTANHDDSTMAISDKVYDRAMVIDLNQRAKPFIAPETESIKLSFQIFTDLVGNAKETYVLSEENRDKINELDQFITLHFGITFGNRTMRQLEEFVPVYVKCGGTENEAIDIIISRKVLRKLEAKNPLFVKRQKEDFIKVLDGLFGMNEMSLCREYLKKFDI